MKIFFPWLCASVVAACSLASGFSSIAQAGTWNGPTYVVSNRSPTKDTNTTVPGGTGSGVTIDMGGGRGMFASGGDPVAGTVKARFTWVPDPNKANDPAPSKVYVLEQGGASWSTGVLTRGGGELQMEGMRPSTTEVSFSRARRGRLFLVQAQTSNGTANDGFGHAQVVAADGQSGSSSGYNVSTLTANGNEVTTAPVTLSASVAQLPNGLPQTSWGYSAKILPLAITCNGQDITDPKPACQVKAGQNSALSFSGVPTGLGLTVTSPSWTLPDKYVKDWVHSDTSASIVSLPAAELSNPSIPQLFWVSGGNKAVSFTANINGTAITLKGNINVDKPSYDFSVIPGAGVSLDGDGAGGATLKLGAYDPATTVGAGVVFSTPNKPNPNNILTTVQVITNTTRLVIDGAGYLHTYSPTSGLDKFGLGSDSPYQGVSATDKEVTVNEAFDTWLMYYPPTGGTEHQDWIYVPLKKLSWSWVGHAKRQGATWMNSDLVSGTPAQAATGSDALVHPQWTQKASPPEGDFVPKL